MWCRLLGGAGCVWCRLLGGVGLCGAGFWLVQVVCGAGCIWCRLCMYGAGCMWCRLCVVQAFGWCRLCVVQVVCDVGCVWCRLCVMQACNHTYSRCRSVRTVLSPEAPDQPGQHSSISSQKTIGTFKNAQVNHTP